MVLEVIKTLKGDQVEKKTHAFNLFGKEIKEAAGEKFGELLGKLLSGEKITNKFESLKLFKFAGKGNLVSEDVKNEQKESATGEKEKAAKESVLIKKPAIKKELFPAPEKVKNNPKTGKIEENKTEGEKDSGEEVSREEVSSKKIANEKPSKKEEEEAVKERQEILRGFNPSNEQVIHQNGKSGRKEDNLKSGKINPKISIKSSLPLSEEDISKLEVKESLAKNLTKKEESEKARVIIADLRKNEFSESSETISKGFVKKDAGDFLKDFDERGGYRFFTTGNENEPARSTGKGSLSTNLSKTDQAAVLKQFQEALNHQIVRQAGFILKDNNSGEIKLLLKPEKLGQVNIRLNLSENNIVGKIIVENNTVREIFENNMEALSRAFRENGFLMGGMDVSVGNRENSRRGLSGNFFKRAARGIKGIENSMHYFEDFVGEEGHISVYV